MKNIYYFCNYNYNSISILSYLISSMQFISNPPPPRLLESFFMFYKRF